MNERFKKLSEDDLGILHDSTLEILRDVGIRFNNAKALNLCKKFGVRVKNEKVFFHESDIAAALETVPSRFSIVARHVKNTIDVGGDDFVLVPGCGATVIVDPEGRQHEGTMDDFDRLCILVHTSRHLDCIGSMLIHPSELPTETSHLDMLLSAITHCDKVIVVLTTSENSAEDAINMGRIVLNANGKPSMIGMISSLPPLQFSDSSTHSLIAFAEAGQAISINASSIMGLTAPITMAGAQIVQNAAFLAGMCLSQMVNPGTPIIYGISGAPMDMRTGSPAYGSPELAKSLFIGAALAKLYKVPCRGGGAFTDTFVPDIQAGLESALVLGAAAMSGMNLSICSCGMLGSYLGMSFEKFLIDEELCGMVKNLILPMHLSEDDVCLDLIKKIGVGNTYMTEPHTLERCRTEFFTPSLLNRGNKEHTEPLHKKATPAISKRLKDYQQPDLDQDKLKELSCYVNDKKRLILNS